VDDLFMRCPFCDEFYLEAERLTKAEWWHVRMAAHIRDKHVGDRKAVLLR
jgi:hypothetical protein